MKRTSAASEIHDVRRQSGRRRNDSKGHRMPALPRQPQARRPARASRRLRQARSTSGTTATARSASRSTASTTTSPSTSAATERSAGNPAAQSGRRGSRSSDELENDERDAPDDPPRRDPAPAVAEPDDEDDSLVEEAPQVPLRAMFRRFWPHTRGFRGRMAMSLLLTGAVPALTTASIYLYKVLVDDVLTPHDFRLFIPVAALYLGITVVAGRCDLDRRVSSPRGSANDSS